MEPYIYTMVQKNHYLIILSNYEFTLRAQVGIEENFYLKEIINLSSINLIKVVLLYVQSGV